MSLIVLSHVRRRENVRVVHRRCCIITYILIEFIAYSPFTILSIFVSCSMNSTDSMLFLLIKTQNLQFLSIFTEIYSITYAYGIIY